MTSFEIKGEGPRFESLRTKINENQPSGVKALDFTDNETFKIWIGEGIPDQDTIYLD